MAGGGEWRRVFFILQLKDDDVTGALATGGNKPGIKRQDAKGRGNYNRRIESSRINRNIFFPIHKALCHGDCENTRFDVIRKQNCVGTCVCERSFLGRCVRCGENVGVSDYSTIRPRFVTRIIARLDLETAFPIIGQSSSRFCQMRRINFPINVFNDRI